MGTPQAGAQCAREDMKQCPACKVPLVLMIYGTITGGPEIWYYRGCPHVE